MARVRAEDTFGSLWFSGVSADGDTSDGPKARMLQRAATIDAGCLVQYNDPARGYRRFGCYRSWSEALANLAAIPPRNRHLFEIIGNGRPCKPYLDIDAKRLPEGFADVAAFAMHYQTLVTRIFSNEYRIELKPTDFAWSTSPKPDKVSLHLVIATHGPQWVFRSNLKTDPQGAMHLASRLRELDRSPDGREACVDITVYSKDREMRCVGATKWERPDSVLLPMELRTVDGRPCAVVAEPSDAMLPPRDSLVTWLDEGAGAVRFIAVPEVMPDTLKRGLRGPYNANETSFDDGGDGGVPRPQKPAPPTQLHPRRQQQQQQLQQQQQQQQQGLSRSGVEFKDFVRARYIEILQGCLHPSARLAENGAAASALPADVAAQLLDLVHDSTLADYANWLKIATACRFDLRGDPDRLWRAFDDRCKRAPGYSEEGNRKLWNGLRDTVTDTTLLHFARRDSPAEFAKIAPRLPRRLATDYVYTDPAERCCFGKKHANDAAAAADSTAGAVAVPLACHIDRALDVFVRCCHPECAGKWPRRIGRVYDDPDVHLEGALRLELPKLSRAADVPGIGPTLIPVEYAVDEAAAKAAIARAAADKAKAPAVARDARPAAADWNITPDAQLNALVEGWARGDFRALSIKSPMGTGKTTLLQSILAQMPPSTTCLVVSYRQSLAIEQERKLREHGFINYLDVKGGLDDREVFPRAICQIESLEKTGRFARAPSHFDVIILDEIESLLRHFCSPTVRSPIAAVSFLIAAVNKRKANLPPPRILTLDAFWGGCSHDFLKNIGASNRLVINTFRPPPRTFEFTGDGARWQQAIIDDLRAGLNVVVVSLSAERLYCIKTDIDQAGVIGAGDSIMHTAKSGDEVKRLLTDVDALWTRFKLVLFSPTISAGVDFSARHFHRMYLYVCPLSCPPLGAMQMTGRVRWLGDATVRCCASAGMQIHGAPARRAITLEETRRYLLWVDRQYRRIDYPTEEVTVQGDDEEFIVPVQTTPLFGIETHFERDRFNAIGRFFFDFRDMAEAAGHVVRVSEDDLRPGGGDNPRREAAAGEDAPAAADAGDRPPPATAARRKHTAEMLLRAPDVDAGAMDAIRKRIFSGKALPEDLWTKYRADYKTGHGIDTVDAAFVERHGTEPRCPRTLQLLLVLIPRLRNINRDCNIAEMTARNRVPYIVETLRALGLKSVFDKETRIPSLMEAWEARVKKTAMFATKESYRNCALLFGATGTIAGDWDLQKVSKAINMVLGSIGMRLIHDTDRKRDDDDRKRVHSNYRLCPKTVDTMLELAKLRLRRMALPEGKGPDNEHAEAALVNCKLPLYGHLLIDNQAALRQSLFANSPLVEDEDVDE